MSISTHRDRREICISLCHEILKTHLSIGPLPLCGRLPLVHSRLATYRNPFVELGLWRLSAHSEVHGHGGGGPPMLSPLMGKASRCMGTT